MPKRIRLLGLWLPFLLMPLSICVGADAEWDYTQHGSATGL